MGSMMGHAEALEKKPSAAAVNPGKYGGHRSANCCRKPCRKPTNGMPSSCAQRRLKAGPRGFGVGVPALPRGPGEPQRAPRSVGPRALKSTIITFGLTIQDVLNNPELTVCNFSHTRGIANDRSWDAWHQGML
jgi:hypothetical protein